MVVTNNPHEIIEKLFPADVIKNLKDRRLHPIARCPSNNCPICRPYRRFYDYMHTHCDEDLCSNG